ncbi:MAG: site-2 protease family protein [Pseudomonadales bacterium]
MKWSWKLVRIAGIDVYIHATFFILLVWQGLAYWNKTGELFAVAQGVLFIIALFGCVVLHEYGHALTARKYGIRTRNITLYPIGGVASLEGMPDDPWQEIKVALAGPAVNLVIAIILYIGFVVFSRAPESEEIDLVTGSFWYRLMVVNIILGVFNLLPAFPMDGGRVVRALLSLRMDKAKATAIAASIGQSISYVLAFLGFMYNPFLLVIAVFIWIAAAAESGAEQLKSALYGATAGQAMLTEFHFLSSADSLAHAVEMTLTGSQKDFPVGDKQQITGVLTQALLLQGLRELGETARVDELALATIQSCDKNEPVEQLMLRLQGQQCPMVAVLDREQVVGIVNLDNVMELISIHSAVKSHLDA